MLKRVTWRSWAVIAAVLAAYAGAGYWFAGNGTAEELLFKWGLLAASLAPLLLVAVYTRSGYKWYQSDLGSAIVQIKLCVVLLVAPLAWTFFFNHGVLHPGALAWIEVSAPALVALAMLRLCYVFARIHRAGDGTSGSKEEGA